MKHTCYIVISFVVWMAAGMVYTQAKHASSFEPTATPSYYLITASYKSFAPAKAETEALIQQGYNAALVFPGLSSNTYKVSIFHDNTRAKVASYQKALAQQGKAKTWIWEKKPVTRALATQASRSADEPESLNTYYLIMGSYNDYSTAFDYQEELRDASYEPDILLPDGYSSKYRVYTYVTDDREEIDAYASMIKKKGVKGAWIHSVPKGQTRGQTSRVIPIPPVGYYLVAASFDRLKDAQAYAQSRRVEGYESAVLPPPGQASRPYRVSLYRSADRDEVSYFNTQLKRLGDAGGWVFTVN